MDKLSKREITDRLHAIDLERATLNEEERMLRELLVEWPDDAIDLLDSEPPDTLPGTQAGREKKSSQKMRAVRMETCGYCEGTGNGAFGSCTYCEGRGVLPPAPKSEPCDACGGCGDGPFGDCPECGGRGTRHPHRS